MALLLRKNINRLKKRLLFLAGMVEKHVSGSILAVENFDEPLAKEIITLDKKIDNAEIAIEEECLKILALYHPVAVDLRIIISILKINNDLERIGDLAVNIAKRVSLIKKHTTPQPLISFNKIANKTKIMLRESLNAFINLDCESAAKVCKSDDEVDSLNKEIYEKAKKLVSQDKENFSLFIHYITISKNLERIADHATNIAEDVIYLMEGNICRHKHIK